MPIDPVSIVVAGGGTLAFDAVREFNKAIFSSLGKRVGEKVSEEIVDDLAQLIQEIATYRIHNWAETSRRAYEFVADAGAVPHGIPPRVLIPLLERSSIEDDEDVRERWAALLAHASVADDPDDVPPVFSDILSQLTPKAAAVLEIIEDTRPLSERPRARGGVVVWQICTALADRFGEEIPGSGEPRIEYEHRVAALVDILVRQGLATTSVTFTDDTRPVLGGPSIVVPRPEGTEVRITELGRAFLGACRPLPHKGQS